MLWESRISRSWKSLTSRNTCFLQGRSPIFLAGVINWYYEMLMIFSALIPSRNNNFSLSCKEDRRSSLQELLLFLLGISAVVKTHVLLRSEWYSTITTTNIIPHNNTWVLTTVSGNFKSISFLMALLLLLLRVPVVIIEVQMLLKFPETTIVSH